MLFPVRSFEQIFIDRLDNWFIRNKAHFAFLTCVMKTKKSAADDLVWRRMLNSFFLSLKCHDLVKNQDISLVLRLIYRDCCRCI